MIKRVFSVRNFTEKDYKEAGFRPPSSTSSSISSHSSPPLLSPNGGGAEKKKNRLSQKVASVKNFGNFGRKKSSLGGGLMGGGERRSSAGGVGGERREEERGFFGGDSGGEVGLAAEGEEQMRVQGRKRRAGVGGGEGEREWGLTDGQMEVLGRHFVGESMGLSSSNMSKLRGLLASEVGGKGKKVGKKLIKEWFMGQRERFGLGEKGKSYLDMSLFDYLLDQQEQERKEKGFSTAQMHIFVRHFVTQSMIPTDEEIVGMLLESGGKVRGEEKVKAWFKGQREGMEGRVRGVKEWLGGEGEGVGLYAVVVGFESEFVSALLTSDLDPHNFS